MGAGGGFRSTTRTASRRFAYSVVRRGSGLHRAPVVLKAIVRLQSGAPQDHSSAGPSPSGYA